MPWVAVCPISLISSVRALPVDENKKWEEIDRKPSLRYVKIINSENELFFILKVLPEDTEKLSTIMYHFDRGYDVSSTRDANLYDAVSLKEKLKYHIPEIDFVYDCTQYTNVPFHKVFFRLHPK